MPASLEEKRKILEQLRGGATIEQKRQILAQLRGTPTPTLSPRQKIEQIADRELTTGNLAPTPINTEALGSLGGEAAGRLAGAPFGPIGSALGGGIGAAGALGISRLSKGEEVSTGELAMEFGLSLLPDFAIKGLGKLAGKVASRTKPGIQKATQEGADFIRAKSQEIFKPLEKQKLDQMFDAVRAAGDKLEPTTFTKGTQNLTKGQFKTISQELNKIAAPPGKSSEGFGEGMQKVFQAIRDGKTAPGIDLGALQHVRSQIQKAAFAASGGSRQDALFNFVDLIDDRIEKGAFRTANGGVELLQNARREFANFKNFEEFSTFIERRITPTTPSGQASSLNLGRLKDVLNNPVSKAEQRVATALSRRPGGKEAITEFLGNMGKVNIEPGLFTSVGGVIGFASNGLATILGAGPAARARFNRLVRDNNNTITKDIISLSLNVARREALGPGQLSQIPGVIP